MVLVNRPNLLAIARHSYSNITRTFDAIRSYSLIPIAGGERWRTLDVGLNTSQGLVLGAGIKDLSREAVIRVSLPNIPLLAATEAALGTASAETPGGLRLSADAGVREAGTSTSLTAVDKQAANGRGSLLEQCQSGSDNHPTPMSMRSTRRGNMTVHGRRSTSVDVLGTATLDGHCSAGPRPLTWKPMPTGIPERPQTRPALA